ncbi:hypothetical protein TNCV_1531921 [Trichonephila clavipes]|nr:hypothetical protein TNCV_1531921 [Trichonephila clavipes]
MHLSFDQTRWLSNELLTVQLAVPNDPRYSRLVTNLGIEKVRESEGGTEPFITGPLHTNTIVTTAQIEFRFVAEDDLVLFRCSPIPTSATPLVTEASFVGVIGSTRDGRHDTICPSARCLAMFQEGTGARIWTAVNEAVGSTRVCRMI